MSESEEEERKKVMHDDDDDDEPTPKKKARGRPKKAVNETPAPKKKARGRPKKTVITTGEEDDEPSYHEDENKKAQIKAKKTARRDMFRKSDLTFETVLDRVAEYISVAQFEIDLEKCIACWGCINRCPKQAIKSTSKEFADIVDSFVQGSQRRQEPELFF